jgi:hypothetical protein
VFSTFGGINVRSLRSWNDRSKRIGDLLCRTLQPQTSGCSKITPKPVYGVPVELLGYGYQRCRACPTACPAASPSSCGRLF